MLNWLREMGRTLSQYANRVGETARHVGSLMVAVADTTEAVSKLWGLNVNDVHEQGEAGVKQTPPRAGPDEAGKGQNQDSDSDNGVRSIQRGARVLGSGSRRGRLPQAVEAAKEEEDGRLDSGPLRTDSDEAVTAAAPTTEVA